MDEPKGCILWIAAKPFSRTSLSLPNGLRNKMAIVESMKVIHEFHKLDFSLIKADLATVTAKCPNTNRRIQQ